MKTKEEVIKEAWGELMPVYTYINLTDGWGKSFFNHKEVDYNLFDFITTIKGSFIRPKLLQGIEHNNGWIKIESEKDLPKGDYGQCFLLHNGSIIYGGFRRYTEETFYFFNASGEGLLENSVTHYQPIVKPKPPIY